MVQARNVLGVPVPKVLAWCSDANRSPIGAEYILMEKVSGRPLAEFWDNMKGRDKISLLQQISDIDSKFASASFPMYGALYYSNYATKVQGSEVPQQAVPREFVVGPTTGRDTFDERRGEVAADLGPCKRLVLDAVKFCL